MNSLSLRLLHRAVGRAVERKRKKISAPFSESFLCLCNPSSWKCKTVKTKRRRDKQRIYDSSETFEKRLKMFYSHWKDHKVVLWGVADALTIATPPASEHLRHKKTKDVQFFVEVMDVVHTLGGGRRSGSDPNEIEEEQWERERKSQTNMDFQNFVNRVNDQWGQPQFRGLDLEFDQPLRELGFHGVPYKASVFLVPVSTCLIELTETPFLVVTLSEIEIVNLERVGLGQKIFDKTIVFKDFKLDVLRIDSIPSSFDGIKEWLNLNW